MSKEPKLSANKLRPVQHLLPGEGPAIWASGDTYTFKSTGRDTEGQLTVFEADIPPGGGPPPHVHHDADEAYYLLEGELEVLDGERTFTARAGDYVYIPRGRLHRFQNVGEGNSRMLVLFTPAGFENFLFEVGLPARPGETPPPVGPEEIARAVRAAPKHHLELRLPELERS